MKVLIIGGTGLISTATSRLLVASGHDVTHCNRGKSSDEFKGKVKEITVDRTRYAELESRMAEAGKWDCVIDMVCFLAEEAKSAIRAFSRRTRQYIFCSTTDVYTKPPSRFPIREDEERKPLKEFPYAWQKAQCERLLEEAHARGDFALTIIRPSATYGEGRGAVDPFRSEPFYFDRIRKGRPLIVHGDGTSLWTSCHRDDVGRAFARAVGNRKAFGNAYNATGEDCMTWNQYWQGIAEALGKPCPPLVHIPTDILLRAVPNRASWCGVNFQHDNIFVNDAARRDLGFEVTIRWAEGMRRSIKWLDDHGGIPACEGFPWYDTIIEAWGRFGSRMAEELAGEDGPFRP